MTEITMRFECAEARIYVECSAESRLDRVREGAHILNLVHNDPELFVLDEINIQFLYSDGASVCSQLDVPKIKVASCPRRI